ncbi:hypothetical protein J2R80_008498 [Bradyrhizobium sp. USDA 4541]|nr:hypothetical protein [Bradyrhizobium sp. USDA 4541]
MHFGHDFVGLYSGRVCVAASWSRPGALIRMPASPDGG